MERKVREYPGAHDVDDLAIIRVINDDKEEDGYDIKESCGVTPVTIFTLNNDNMIYFYYLDNVLHFRELSPRIYMGIELTNEELIQLRDEYLNMLGESNKFITYLNNLINNDVRACMTFNGDVEAMEDDSICYSEFLKALKEYYIHCIDIDDALNVTIENHKKCLELVKSETDRYDEFRGV